MGTGIAAERGIPITKNEALTAIKEISGVVGLGLLAQQVAMGASQSRLSQNMDDQFSSDLFE